MLYKEFYFKILHKINIFQRLLAYYFYIAFFYNFDNIIDMIIIIAVLLMIQIKLNFLKLFSQENRLMSNKIYQKSNFL